MHIGNWQCLLGRSLPFFSCWAAALPFPLLECPNSFWLLQQFLHCSFLPFRRLLLLCCSFLPLCLLLLLCCGSLPLCRLLLLCCGSLP